MSEECSKKEESDGEREIENERQTERELSAYQWIRPKGAHFVEGSRAVPLPLHIYKAVLTVQ